MLESKAQLNLANNCIKGSAQQLLNAGGIYYLLSILAQFSQTKGHVFPLNNCEEQDEMIRLTDKHMIKEQLFLLKKFDVPEVLMELVKLLCPYYNSGKWETVR